MTHILSSGMVTSFSSSQPRHSHMGEVPERWLSDLRCGLFSNPTQKKFVRFKMSQFDPTRRMKLVVRNQQMPSISKRLPVFDSDKLPNAPDCIQTSYAYQY